MMGVEFRIFGVGRAHLELIDEMIRLICVLLIQLVGICFGGGVLNLSFSQFTHNLQCDYLSQCDLKFVICVDHGNSSVGDFHEECKFLREEVRDLASVSIHFKQWPGSVVLKIVILDVDLFGNDLMDYMYAHINNKPGGKVQLELKNRTKLVVTTELRCDFEYFGPNCSVFCSQRDDETGHFKCNRLTGEYICLKGWGGANCNYRSVISNANEYRNFTNGNSNSNKAQNPKTIPNYYFFEDYDSSTTSPAPAPVLADDPNILVNEIGDDILTAFEISFDNETEEATTSPSPSTTDNQDFGEYKPSENFSENFSLVESVTEIQLSERNEVSGGNYSEEALTFSFPLNDTAGNVSNLSPDGLQYRFRAVLKRYFGEDMRYMKVNVTIINERLQIIITVQLDVGNETILQRVKSSIIQEKSNIESSFMQEAFTTDDNVHTIRPKSKSVPEWAIILVVITVVLIVLITMRQSHKYCVSKNLMKPKELDEEPDGDLVQPTALNFTNPIYSRPKN